ncbi:unnamed protein product, partial [Strongylus vulgaris]
VISHEDGVVKFKRFTSYIFNETESCQTCILGNRIWIPNMIYQRNQAEALADVIAMSAFLYVWDSEVVLAYKTHIHFLRHFVHKVFLKKFVEAASTTGMRAAATTLLSQTAFLEVEVGEFLFEGYKDPFLDKVCEIPFMNFVSFVNSSNCLKYQIPSTFTLLFKSNNTADGVWSSPGARLIRGTEGMLFPPFLKKSERIYVFISQLCRSVWLEFQKEVDYKGVPAYRFWLPPEVFDPTSPENEGYCNPTDKKFFGSQNISDDCFPAGLLEISKCQRSKFLLTSIDGSYYHPIAPLLGQAPIMISLPNFNFASDEVRESVKGLNSTDPERDIIIVDIEPVGKLFSLLPSILCNSPNRI